MEENMENLNPVTEPFNGLVATEVGNTSMETVTAELIPVVDESVSATTTKSDRLKKSFEEQGIETHEITSPVVFPIEEHSGLDMSKLTDEQKDQLKELQKKMDLYHQSRSGHIEGNAIRTNDGVNYTVTKSGAYQRLGPPKKSRKAEHRKEVANRKSGKV